MDLSQIPKIGWIAILIFGTLLLGALVLIVYLIVKGLGGKEVKTPVFSITEKEKKEHEQAKKDLLIGEGKEQLENQCQVAKNILKELRVKIYDSGVAKLRITDSKDLSIMRLISYNIIDMVNYEVKADLTRNHIASKTSSELDSYIKAKSKGYFSMIKNHLYTYNPDLPDFDLPVIMDEVTLPFVEAVMKDVYLSSRNIVGVS